jgi:hypothetical protein
LKGDKGIQRAVDRGEKNRAAIELAQNWCAHLRVEVWGGVGLLEQMTDLPIGTRRFTCQYAHDDGVVTMDAEDAAVRFYRANCVGCDKRQPVRIPNLLQLVQGRDEQSAREERERAEAATAAEAVFDARAEGRKAVRDGLDATSSGLVDLIQRLDEEPTEEDAGILGEAARAAPTRFSRDILGLLYDLMEAGGDLRARASLAALDLLETDRPRLSRAALVVLARGLAVELSADLGTKELSGVNEDEVKPAIPVLIYLASPRIPPIVGSGRPEDPTPLLRVRAAFREAVIDVARMQLRAGSPYERQTTCNAVTTMIAHDPRLGVELGEDLIRVLLLAEDDDIYTEGAARRALARALSHCPKDIDELIRRTEEIGSSADRKTLFGIFEWLLRDGRDALQPESVDAAMSHVVEALATPLEDGRLQDAASALETVRESWPNVVARSADSLLGAAALLAERLDAPPESFVEKTVPKALAVLEAGNRRNAVHHALLVITKTLGGLSPAFPTSVGETFQRTLAGLDHRHEWLRAAMIEGVGEMGQVQQGLTLALPVLYGGLVHASQLVRASAARAYGEIVERSPNGLPDLVHQAFLLLLTDPYRIVHQAAVRVLEHERIPEPFRPEASALVWNVIAVYAESRDNDQFLSTAIDAFLGLRSGPTDLSAKNRRIIIGILRRMDPNAAWDVARFWGRRLTEDPSYVEFLLELLANPATYPFRITDPVLQLHNARPEQLRDAAERLPLIAGHVRKMTSGDFNEHDPTDYFIDLLSRAGSWASAVQVAQEALDEVEDTKWNRGRRLHLEMRLIAVRLEATTAGLVDLVQAELLTRWDTLGKEIEAYNASNTRHDGFPFDL